MSLKSFSQTSDSCTCIPNSQLRIAARLIEQGRLDSIELNLTKRSFLLSQDVIKEQTKVITAWEGKEDVWKKLEANFEKEKVALLDEVGYANREIVKLNKDIKRQKRKTVLTGIAGLLATALTIYITSK